MSDKHSVYNVPPSVHSLVVCTEISLLSCEICTHSLGCKRMKLEHYNNYFNVFQTLFLTLYIQDMFKNDQLRIRTICDYNLKQGTLIPNNAHCSTGSVTHAMQLPWAIASHKAMRCWLKLHYGNNSYLSPIIIVLAGSNLVLKKNKYIQNKKRKNQSKHLQMLNDFKHGGMWLPHDERLALCSTFHTGHYAPST